MKKILLSFVISSVICTSVYAADQVNNLDCSDEEVSAYMDKTNYKRASSYNTAPSFEEYQKPYIGLQRVEKGEAAANNCLNVFNGGMDYGTMAEKATGIMDSISDILSDPGGSLANISSELKKRAYEMYGKTKSQTTKTLCERVISTAKNTANEVGGSINGPIRDATSAVKNTTVGSMISTGKTSNTASVLRGTDNSSDSIFYKILQNQVGKSESSIGKLLNMSNINVNKTAGNVVNSQLDNLENVIFGK